MISIRPIYIYSLIDPLTGSIRYIGKTFNTEGRLSQHIQESIKIREGNGRRKNNKRYSWILNLLDNNTKPILEIIETCFSTESSNEREKYWISIIPNLVNMTKGGDGGDTNSGKKFGPVSDELKIKISKSTKESMKSDEIRNKCSIGGKITSQKIKNDEEFRNELFKKIRNGAKKRVCFFDNQGKVNLIYDSISDYKISNKNNQDLDNLITFRGMWCKYETSDIVNVISSEEIEIKSKNKKTKFTYEFLEKQL